MKIAFGAKRTSRVWRSKDMSFDDFCHKVEQTTRTSETVAEYAAMDKAEQDDIKDKGGFVGGELRDCTRKKGYVIRRDMLTLDADYGMPVNMPSTDWCLYSTHKHTPECPRLRVCIPLTRPVTEEEYPAIARVVAKDIDIELFDDSTYQPHRLMYLPTTSRDGEFVFKRSSYSNPLDPDEYLARYDDWRDASSWPVSSRCERALQTSASAQGDPLTKEGVIGLFCRAYYPINLAIEELLTDVYKKSEVPGRYDYVQGSTTSGVEVFDGGKFVYSFHATDPAGGRLCNAYDLVRIHKDNGKGFHEWIYSLERVKKQQNEELGRTFESWLGDLEVGKNGQYKPTLSNLLSIMRNDERIKTVKFNAMNEKIVFSEQPPWDTAGRTEWTQFDFDNLVAYVDAEYGIDNTQRTQQAFRATVRERAFHPIREYLEALEPWDGAQRAETLLIDLFGASDDAYTRAVTRKTLLAAVKRVYEPGCQFDGVLVLVGPQGIGKSRFFHRLGVKWFSDSLTLNDTKDKSGAEKLQDNWIMEIAELQGMRKAEAEDVKAFITRTDDKYRAAYAPTVTSHPRTCIIVGSTNSEDGFLRDSTGNRRFWPVIVPEVCKDREFDVDQVWAEALWLYRNKPEDLYLTGEASEIAETRQREAVEDDLRRGLVETYLDTPIPINWKKLSISERCEYLNGVRDVVVSDDTELREYVSLVEIVVECFGVDKDRIKASDKADARRIMLNLPNWSDRADKPIKDKNYGTQRCYSRIV